MTAGAHHGSLLSTQLRGTFVSQQPGAFYPSLAPNPDATWVGGALRGKS